MMFIVRRRWLGQEVVCVEHVARYRGPNLAMQHRDRGMNSSPSCVCENRALPQSILEVSRMTAKAGY